MGETLIYFLMMNITYHNYIVKLKKTEILELIFHENYYTKF